MKHIGLQVILPKFSQRTALNGFTHFLKQHQLDANTILADGQQTLVQALADKDLTAPIQTFKTADELSGTTFTLA